jgi:hypothetical protein
MDGRGTFMENEIYRNTHAGVAVEEGGTPKFEGNAIYEGEADGVVCTAVRDMALLCVLCVAMCVQVQVYACRHMCDPTVHSAYMYIHANIIYTHAHIYMHPYMGCVQKEHTYIHAYIHTYIHTYIHPCRQYGCGTFEKNIISKNTLMGEFYLQLSLSSSSHSPPHAMTRERAVQPSTTNTNARESQTANIQTQVEHARDSEKLGSCALVRSHAWSNKSHWRMLRLLLTREQNMRTCQQQTTYHLLRSFLNVFTYRNMHLN